MFVIVVVIVVVCHVILFSSKFIYLCVRITITTCVNQNTILHHTFSKRKSIQCLHAHECMCYVRKMLTTVFICVCISQQAI